MRTERKRYLNIWRIDTFVDLFHFYYVIFFVVVNVTFGSISVDSNERLLVEKKMRLKHKKYRGKSLRICECWFTWKNNTMNNSDVENFCRFHFRITKARENEQFSRFHIFIRPHKPSFIFFSSPFKQCKLWLNEKSICWVLPRWNFAHLRRRFSPLDSTSR